MESIRCTVRNFRPVKADGGVVKGAEMVASATPLELEERRRRRMSLAILAGLLVSGVAISNERALFTTGFFDEAEAAATIKALAAVVPPTPWQAIGVPRVFPIHRARQALTPPPPTPPAAFAARVPQPATPTEQVSPLATPDIDAPGVPDLPPPLIFAGPGPGPVGPILSSSGGGSSGGGSSGGTSSGASSSGGDTPGVPSAVPEPSTWAMIILGFGCIGGILRLAGRRLARAEARAA